MKLFDYYFYRMYQFYESRNDPALFTSSMFTAVVFLDLFSMIWWNILNYLVKDLNNIPVTMLYIISSILSYLRYRKEKNRIFEEFKESKYNTILPNWIFPAFVPISIIVGIFFNFSIRSLFGL